MTLLAYDHQIVVLSFIGVTFRNRDAAVGHRKSEIVLTNQEKCLIGEPRHVEYLRRHILSGFVSRGRCERGQIGLNRHLERRRDNLLERDNIAWIFGLWKRLMPAPLANVDRNSVVLGKSVEVIVHFSGRFIFKTKKKEK